MHEKVTIRSQISEKLVLGKPSGAAGWQNVCAVSKLI